MKIVNKDFQLLKAACKSEKIELELARRIFTDLDSTFLESPEIRITFIPFSKNKNDFGQFATRRNAPAPGHCSRKRVRELRYRPVPDL